LPLFTYEKGSKAEAKVKAIVQKDKGNPNLMACPFVAI
jgi:hypothetical protein